MELLNVFSAFGLSASSGLNAYIPLLTVALLAKFTNLITLQSPWDALTNWWVIGGLVCLCLLEFLADSSPIVNHINDLLQSFVRPIAGALIFAATAKIITDLHPALALLAGLVIAGGVHTIKATVVRPTITATTGGSANVAVAMAEDATAFGTSLLATITPWLFIILVLILVLWLFFLPPWRTDLKYN